MAHMLHPSWHTSCTLTHALAHQQTFVRSRTLYVRPQLSAQSPTQAYPRTLRTHTPTLDHSLPPTRTFVHTHSTHTHTHTHSHTHTHDCPITRLSSHIAGTRQRGTRRAPVGGAHTPSLARKTTTTSTQRHSLRGALITSSSVSASLHPTCQQHDGAQTSLCMYYFAFRRACRVNNVEPLEHSPRTPSNASTPSLGPSLT
jgi:hypothetical protein